MNSLIKQSTKPFKFVVIIYLTGWQSEMTIFFLSIWKIMLRSRIARSSDLGIARSSNLELVVRSLWKYVELTFNVFSKEVW